MERSTEFSWFLILCSVGFVLCFEHDFKGFDDSILFAINWPGSNIAENLLDKDKDKVSNKEVMKVLTSNDETYECKIPELLTSEKTSLEDYDGPSPIHLLKPLFAQNICSFRLESYWSYEVCHGRYIRQYHEEREGKQVSAQVFYLGRWNAEKQTKLEADIKASLEKKEKPKTAKVESINLPSVEMVMDDGTLCDLNNKPRLTRVKYICYSQGKHEIYSFKETSTCEYEIVILSPLLCEHPHFKPHEVTENNIDCIPIGGTAMKPQGLLRMEFESLRMQHQSMKMMNNDKDTKDVLAVLKVEKVDKIGETRLKFELHSLDEEPDATEAVTKAPQLADKPPIINDDSPVVAFLNGENCLNGGTGWWKYEFCFGKHVAQYHVDRAGERTTLLLGEFRDDAHRDWLRDNKAKAPRPIEQRTSISHFYSNGDICDKTGKPRQTEVKLKCLENSSSPAQVSLYLLEPRTCHYILGVESSLICDILPLVDEYGLIKSFTPTSKKQTNVKESKDDDKSESREKYVVKFDND